MSMATRVVTRNSRVVASTIASAVAKSRRGETFPRGMAGSGLPFARDADGFVEDPVSMARIPPARAVKIGMHTFNAKTIRELRRRSAAPRNPLTRQPIPQSVLRAVARK